MIFFKSFNTTLKSIHGRTISIFRSSLVSSHQRVSQICKTSLFVTIYGNGYNIFKPTLRRGDLQGLQCSPCRYCSSSHLWYVFIILARLFLLFLFSHYKFILNFLTFIWLVLSRLFADVDEFYSNCDPGYFTYTLPDFTFMICNHQFGNIDCMLSTSSLTKNYS